MNLVTDRGKIEDFKNSIDLRQWFQQQGYTPKTRGSAAWNFPCPLHGETHGAALAVYQNSWKCFGACADGGDIFKFIMKRDSVNFAEALRIAGVDLSQAPTTNRAQPPAPRPTPRVEPPSDDLQTRMRELVEEAHVNLLNTESALSYLNKRGLRLKTIRDARIGYSNGNAGFWHKHNGLNVPDNSLLIPWFGGGHLWGIKTRSLGYGMPKEQRYRQVSVQKELVLTIGTPQLAAALYWVNAIVPQRPILIVEGELNALSAWQSCRNAYDQQLMFPVSIGAAGGHIDPRWYPRLICAPKVFALFDQDEAGNKARARFGALNVKMVSLPEGVKDINEMLVHRPADLQAWYAQLLGVPHAHES